MTDQQNQVLRILDANLNRSTEALRTIEEYTRFILEDTLLTEKAKRLRHEVQALATDLPLVERVYARDARGDIGREITTDSEYDRTDVADVVKAGLNRLKQSLRALEEYGKIIDPAIASRFEQLRYEAYDLEKGLITQDAANERFASLQVYALVSGAENESDFKAHAESLLAAGIDVIQLRDKQLDDEQLLARAKTLRQLIDSAIERSGRFVMMIVNDRPDVAKLAGADGVHLGQTELSVSNARCLLGPKMIVGVSTHNAEQVNQAVLDGADYLGCGPTFPSKTKAFDGFPGLEFLEWVAQNCALPAFAIGGITVENVSQVAEVGISRVAVSGCLDLTADHREVISKLRLRLQSDQEESQFECDEL